MWKFPLCSIWTYYQSYPALNEHQPTCATKSAETWRTKHLKSFFFVFYVLWRRKCIQHISAKWYTTMRCTECLHCFCLLQQFSFFNFYNFTRSSSCYNKKLFMIIMTYFLIITRYEIILFLQWTYNNLL